MGVAGEEEAVGKAAGIVNGIVELGYKERGAWGFLP